MLISEKEDLLVCPLFPPCPLKLRGMNRKPCFLPTRREEPRVRVDWEERVQGSLRLIHFDFDAPDVPMEIRE